MAKEELENVVEEFETVQASSKGSFSFEQLIEEKKQPLMIGGGILLAVIAVLLFVFIKWLPERNLTAQKEMRFAEMAFAKDSFEVALNGRATPGTTPFKGFAQVAKDYSFTKASTLANYYAGVCCLNLKKYDQAISYLNSGKVDDPIIGAVRLSALGDASAELGKMDDAISYYEKAAAYSANDQFTPYFLLKAGLANEKQGKAADAKKIYEKIRDNYPSSDEGRDIEKYIARVTAGA